MFRTTKCLSLGRLVHAVFWYFFMHPHKQSGRCQDVFDQTHPDIDQTAYTNAWKNVIKLHVCVFLRTNTWLFETCRRQYNWIKSLTKKVCVLLVLTTYVTDSVLLYRPTSVSWFHHQSGVQLVTEWTRSWKKHCCLWCLLEIGLYLRIWVPTPCQ